MAEQKTNPPDPQEQKMIEEEIDDLRHEIEMFHKEKERVRKIVGHIGGVPTFNTKLFNLIFALSLVLCFAVSLVFFRNELIRLAMIELALALVSVKLILLIHNQSKVNHLQLWILSSLEWRLDEIRKSAKGGKEPD